MTNSTHHSEDTQPASPESRLRWYEGISRPQWFVLIIASLGWVFDVFEGQIFVASMNEAMPQLLSSSQELPPEQLQTQLNAWNNYALASFLLGGAFGGIVFGLLSDRWGRTRMMILTILFYSIFTCITAFVTAPWQMVALRFLVAMGVGGEWAVATAMVAEVMPKRSRPVMGSIFHASSVFGTLMAVAVGYFVISPRFLGDNTWRLGFLIGVFPALLTIVIRMRMRESDRWIESSKTQKSEALLPLNLLTRLFSTTYLRNTLVGVALATIGLTTFWGCHIYGKDTLKRIAQSQAPNVEGLSETQAAQAIEQHKSYVKQEEMLGMFLTMVIGGGLGLVTFGGISARIGRKPAFVLFHAGGLITSAVLAYISQNPSVSRGLVICFLPVFGYLTLGMHAGYAVYFPELFPTSIRGTGTGFCFNAGRIGSAVAMLTAAMLQWTPIQSSQAMIPLFGLGIAISLAGKETAHEELPE